VVVGYGLVAQDKSGLISCPKSKINENNNQVEAYQKAAEYGNQEIMEEKAIKQNLKKRSSFFNIEDIIISI